jgi:hypothetical protein
VKPRSNTRGTRVDTPQKKKGYPTLNKRCLRKQQQPKPKRQKEGEQQAALKKTQLEIKKKPTTGGRKDKTQASWQSYEMTTLSALEALRLFRGCFVVPFRTDT